MLPGPDPGSRLPEREVPARGPGQRCDNDHPDKGEAEPQAMQWRDEGVLISVRRHGEGAAIIEVFTESHGRHAGLVRGGGSRRMAPILQPGAQLSLEWSARLEDHLGSFRVDPIKSRASAIMGERTALAGIGAITALSTLALPEREPHPALYAQTLQLVDALGVTSDWPVLYALWELALLRDLGYGLDLGSCAANGTTDDLVYVSPRTGRAVSREGGAEYADRLLALSQFLVTGVASSKPTYDEVSDALRLTGYFLLNRLAPALGKESLPPARDRLIEVLFRRRPNRRD